MSKRRNSTKFVPIACASQTPSLRIYNLNFDANTKQIYIAVIELALPNYV